MNRAASLKAAILRVWPHYEEDSRALEIELAHQLREAPVCQRGSINWGGFPLGILLKQRLSEAQNHRCCYCGRRMDGTASARRPKRSFPTFEHVIPLVRGGPDHPDNLVIACHADNQARGIQVLRYEDFGMQPPGSIDQQLEQQAMADMTPLDTPTRKLQLASSEIAEVLRDLTFSVLCPDSEHKVAKVAGCAAGLARVHNRLRSAFGPARLTLEEEALAAADELVTAILSPGAENQFPGCHSSALKLRKALDRIKENG